MLVAVLTGRQQLKIVSAAAGAGKLGCLAVSAAAAAATAASGSASWLGELETKWRFLCRGLGGSGQLEVRQAEDSVR